MNDTIDVCENLLREHGKSESYESKVNEVILDVAEFAAVFPEHEFEIVKRLHDMSYSLVMTDKLLSFRRDIVLLFIS